MARHSDPDLENRILKTARKLWKKGAGEALTMRAVARAAHTTAPAVYRRFRTRDDILRALGFTPTFRYEKYRAEWSDGKGHVVLDETPIGTFGEIEGPSRWIDLTAQALGINPTHYITQTYAEMFFAWKRRSRSQATEMTFRALGKKSKLPIRQQPGR